MYTIDILAQHLKKIRGKKCSKALHRRFRYYLTLSLELDWQGRRQCLLRIPSKNTKTFRNIPVITSNPSEEHKQIVLESIWIENLRIILITFWEVNGGDSDVISSNRRLSTVSKFNFNPTTFLNTESFWHHSKHQYDKI